MPEIWEGMCTELKMHTRCEASRSKYDPSWVGLQLFNPCLQILFVYAVEERRYHDSNYLTFRERQNDGDHKKQWLPGVQGKKEKKE